MIMSKNNDDGFPRLDLLPGVTTQEASREVRSTIRTVLAREKITGFKADSRYEPATKFSPAEVVIGMSSPVRATLVASIGSNDAGFIRVSLPRTWVEHAKQMDQAGLRPTARERRYHLARLHIADAILNSDIIDRSKIEKVGG